MARTTIQTLRALIIAGLFLLVCLVSRAPAQTASSAEETAFYAEFPMGLVYRGVALYAAKDYEGAVAAWQDYLGRSGSEIDSAAVNELIREAWVHAYPLSLVYDGYARYVDNDIAGAINSFERYIELAPASADTEAIREMIVQVLIPAQELARISARAVKEYPITKQR